MTAPSPFLAAALAALAGLAACDTRVVELIQVPDAGGSTVTCSQFVRDDGATCRICFGPDGAATAIFCPMDPGAATMSVPPPPGTCQVTVDGPDRCALCPSAMGGGTLMTCLKCEPPMPGGASQCRVCGWSDNPSARCRQCFAADGTRTDDGCDRLRSERLVYPPPDGGAG